MKFQPLCILSCLLLAAGCSDGKQGVQGGLPEINLNIEYPEKEIWLQEVADVEYIPLETNDSMLFQGQITAVSDKGILGMSNSGDKLFLFDGKGKAKGTLCKKGNGPGEYTLAYSVDVDWQREEIYVLGLPDKVYVYAFDGTCKRVLDTKADVRQRDMFNHSPDKLVYFKESKAGKRGSVAPYRPVVLLDKQGKGFDTLQYVKTWDAEIAIVLVGNEKMKAHLWCESMLAQGGETYLNDIASDTVYRIDKKTNELLPVLLRTPSVREEEGGKFYLRLDGAASHYYFLRRQASCLKATGVKIEDKESHSLVYDRQVGEVFRPVFRNKDFASEEWDFVARTNGEKDCLYRKIEAFELKAALDEGGLDGPLKEIAQALGEDDNPVLMVARFR